MRGGCCLGGFFDAKAQRNAKTQREEGDSISFASFAPLCVFASKNRHESHPARRPFP
jgi:hypothetical protein